MVGESNRFAVAAAQAVAKTPGRAWNPLFLHGDSGLGKTHLLHAIANAIHGSTPGARVAIVTSERYTNDFVDALSRNTMADFRRKYRECGALLVDDVQFFAGRDKTAEEFFHTFNTLYEQNVQIVLSSDRSPKELKGLEERLCSRFEWGMRVHIDTPEFETRAAILKKKALAERDRPLRRRGLPARHPHQVERPGAGGGAHAPRRLRLAEGRAHLDRRWPATSSPTSSRPPATVPPSSASRRPWRPTTASPWPA